jgi:hypothetical protein
MAKEYLVLNSVVACLTTHNVTWRHGTKTLISHFAGLSKKLEVICQPPQDEVIRFNHRAYYPVYASSDNSVSGCSWTRADKAGGIGQVVLAPLGQANARIRIRIGVKLVVPENDKTASLTVEHNPTMMTIGSNIHPAASSIRQHGCQ